MSAARGPQLLVLFTLGDPESLPLAVSRLVLCPDPQDSGWSSRPPGLSGAVVSRICECGTQAGAVFKTKGSGEHKLGRDPHSEELKWLKGMGPEGDEEGHGGRQCGARPMRPQSSSLPLPSQETLASYPSPLCLGFLACEMRMLIYVPQKVVVRIK